MRNLKKVLSLALAMVMLLGMMVVGAGATSFTDDADITHQEAVTVVSGMEILTGVGDNTFNPKGTLSRAEAAVVIAKLDLGAAFGNLATTNASTFKDVGAGYGWAKPYIDYCAARGLIAGDGNGYFMPADKVTGVQFALMVARVLGYEDANESIGGANWEVNAAALARKAGLTVDVTLGSDPIPRDDMAQVAFNALQADMVEYKQSAITIGDITIPAGKASPVENTANDPDYNSATDGKLQLCEEKFPKLSLDTTRTDDMGRPANVWTYKSDVIATVAKTADRTVVVDKEQSLANEIKDINKNWTTINDSSMNGGNLSGNVLVGDVVEVYLDSNTPNTVEYAAVTRYSVDEVTGSVTTKGSAEDDDLQIRIPGFIGYTDADKVDGNYADLAKDDIIYYYRDDAGVYHFAKADSFEGTYTGTKSGTPLKMVINGENHVENGNVAPINNTTDKNASYNFYTDPNGYLIFSKKNEETSKDYVVIQEIDYAAGTGGITGSRAVEARLVKMDGTTEVVKIASVKVGSDTYTKINTKDNDGTDNVEDKDGSTSLAANTKWLAFDQDTDATEFNVAVHTAVSGLTGKAFFTYSINSDKEYELTKVAVSGDITHNAALSANNAVIDTGKASMTGVTGVAVNQNTIFVVATESGGKSFKVYNGIGEVPKITLDATGSNNKCAYIAEKNIATYVYVGSFDTSEVAGDSVFFLKAATKYEAFMTEKVGDDTIYYKTYKAIVDGKYEEVKVKTDSSGTLVSAANGLNIELFTPTYDDNGLITKLVQKNTDASVATGYTKSSGILLAGNTPYTCADDALAFIMDTDGKVTEGTAADLDTDENDSVYVVKTNTTDSIVDFVVIIENSDSDTGYSEISIEDGSNDLTLTGNAAQFAVSGDTITITRTATVVLSGAGGVTVTATGVGADVQYSTTSATAGFSSSAPTTLTFAAQDATDDKTTTVWVKITSVDGSVTVYTINVVTPHA